MGYEGGNSSSLDGDEYQWLMTNNNSWYMDDKLIAHNNTHKNLVIS